MEKNKKTKRTLGGELARSAAAGLTGPFNILPFVANSPFYYHNFVNSPSTSQFGRAAKSVLKGVANPLGVANSMIYGSKFEPEGSYIEPPVNYPAQLVKDELDKLAGVYGEPKTLAQESLGLGLESLLGGGINSLAKMGGVMSARRLAKEALTSGGAGVVEGAVLNKTDNPVVALLASLLAGNVSNKAANLPETLEGLKPSKRALNNLKRSLGDDFDNAILNKQEANSVGLNLSPAEASGNPQVGRFEGKLGVSYKGAKKQHEFAQQSLKDQKNAISGVINELNPTEKNVSSDVRKVASEIINGDKQALIQKAKPFYDEAAHQTLSMDSFKKAYGDPVIENAIKKVLNSDLYAKEIEGYPINSIKILDLAKKNIDSRIKVEIRKGDEEKVRLLTQSKHRLLEGMDVISPEYKKARSIYEEDSPAIRALSESEVGKIANLDEIGLKRLGNTIFDPKQYDDDAFRRVRNRISEKNPQLWNEFVGQEMLNKISAGGKTGSNFYNNILKDERVYKKFQMALKNNPEALKKLNIMKSSFANLIGERTAKNASFLAESSLDVPRSSPEFILKMINKITGGAYDKAAVNLITSNNWDKELQNISEIKNPKARAYQFISVLNAAKNEEQPELGLDEINQLLGGQQNIQQQNLAPELSEEEIDILLAQ